MNPADISSEANITLNDHGQYEIKFKRGLPDFAPYYPRRFAIAHEIAHTYWFAGPNTCSPLSSLQRRSGTDRTIEIICNRFAASLLLPRRRVIRAMQLLATNFEPTLLPLFAIPKLSEYFKIAERAVAQRLYFFLGPKIKAIVCLRLETNRNPLFKPLMSEKRSWISSWCAFPSQMSERTLENGFRIPLQRKKRIPDDMMPAIEMGSTQELELDPRWAIGVEPAPSENARKRFSNIESTAPPRGYACKLNVRVKNQTEERMYLAIF